MLTLAAHIIIFLLFVAAAWVQLLHEGVIYRQKDNKAGYAKLESKRKSFRNFLYGFFFLLGIGATIAGLRSIPTLFAGTVIYWILFDGWFATTVLKKGWWFVGFTSKLDAGIATEKKSKLYKIISAVVAAAGMGLNIVL